MSDNQEFNVELVEKDLINVEIVEKELVTVDWNVIDLLHDVFDEQIIQDHFVFSESPAKLTARKFQTLNSYISGTLRVMLNGIKEKYIIEESTNTFSFEIDTVADDVVEVDYIKP